MSYRVIIAEHARPVAEKIKKDGSPEIKGLRNRRIGSVLP